MARILVSGLINIETTVRVDGFPLDWFPVTYAFDRIASSVSGVGYNTAKALRTLGHEVRFLSMIADDDAGRLVRAAIARDGLPADDILNALSATPQSVILYDGDGRRQIHVDLKDAQEASYPAERFRAAVAGCDAAILCNVNFTRPLLSAARAASVPIVTDVHVLESLDDPYNGDYLRQADVLFVSGDKLPCSPAEWANRVATRFGTRIVIIGDGARGAWLRTADAPKATRIPAAKGLRRVVSTIGAGDALCSAFVHGWVSGLAPRQALRAATVFAAHKIGVASASDGFLSAPELDRLVAELPEDDS